MKIAVIGSRKFPSKQVVQNEVRNFFLNYLFPLRLFDGGQGPVFISGGAHGVDKIAEAEVDQINEEEQEVCKEESSKKWFWKIEKDIKLPDFTDFNKISYGEKVVRYHARNRDIIDTADFILVFWDGISGGTKMGINYAMSKGKCMNIWIRTEADYKRLQQLMTDIENS